MSQICVAIFLVQSPESMNIGKSYFMTAWQKIGKLFAYVHGSSFASFIGVVQIPIRAMGTIAAVLTSHTTLSPTVSICLYKRDTFGSCLSRRKKSDFFAITNLPEFFNLIFHDDIIKII